MQQDHLNIVHLENGMWAAYLTGKQELYSAATPVEAAMKLFEANGFTEISQELLDAIESIEKEEE